jgi:outer membrane protein assembly factor BamB
VLSVRTTISCRFFAQASTIAVAVFMAGFVFAQTPSQVPPPRPFPQPPVTTTPAERARLRELRANPPPETVPGLERWSVALGGSSPVPPLMTDSQVFAVVPPQAVAAFRIDDGAEIWRVELAAEFPLSFDEGRLFVASGEEMHALDAATGKAAWRQPTGALAAPPLVSGGWVVTASGSELIARRASDGTVVWRQTHGVLTLRPAIDGDTLLLSLADARVRAVDLRSGALKWERPMGGVPSEIAALAGRVYVGSGDRYFYCLDASDGGVEWRHRVGGALVGPPAIDADRVYFAAMDNVIRALDRVDGALKWQAGVPFRPSAGPTLFGTAVVVPGAAQEVRTFDVRTGKVGRTLTFAAELKGFDLRMSGEGPIAATITGGLTAEWKLAVWEPSMTIPVEPLTVLPGKATALPAAPPPGVGRP